jgi:hypothetical protein
MDVLLRRVGDRFFNIFATGQMSLVRIQCVAVQEKIQPLFKRVFELAANDELTIGGIFADGASKGWIAVDSSRAVGMVTHGTSGKNTRASVT